MKSFIYTLTFLLSFSFLSSCGSGGSNNQTGEIQPDSDYQRPVYTTNDGKEILLLSKKDVEESIKIRDQILEYESKNSQNQSYSEISTTALPRKVFLKDYQTSIKNQGGRGTCVSFAVAGAIEALYKRKYGLNLDLSEQFLNHMQKFSI